MAKKLGGILRRELLPQFLNDSHGIWHRCSPWGVDVQDIDDIFFEMRMRLTVAECALPW